MMTLQTLYALIHRAALKLNGTLEFQIDTEIAIININSIKLQIVSSPDNLKSQIVTSSWSGNRKLPYAFTELGINMLSAAKCEYLILNGETVEASVAYRNIYGQAKESICIIDNYIDIKTLYLLNDIGSSIKCQIFSDNIENKLRLCDHNNFSAEYNIHIDFFTAQRTIHDRCIVLDYNKDTGQIYHCGASSKDAGNKVTTITKVSDNTIYHPLIDVLNNNPNLSLT